MEAKPTAVILVNLGTPKQPNSRAVRRFLNSFLSDRRVVDLPRLLWLPILYGIILPFRAPRVAKLYEKIWWPEGSPLQVITNRQVCKLRDRLINKNFVDFAMVYGGPSLHQKVQELIASGVSRAVILPLYPQFCSATTGSVCDQLEILHRQVSEKIQLHLVESYHDHEYYIRALANSVSEYWKSNGQSEKLLFSFHGIPQSLIDSGDPYYQQCHESAALVAKLLNLKDSEWKVCFQSRFGKAEWAKPYTDQVIEQLAGENIQKIDVLTPAFASDCLETLEEIAVENAKLFEVNGGNTLRLIPCLNDRDDHIDLLEQLFNSSTAQFEKNSKII